MLWTLLAFLTAAGAHVYTASMGTPISWAQLLAWNIYHLFRLVAADARRLRTLAALHLRPRQLEAVPPHTRRRQRSARVCRCSRAGAVDPLITWTKEPSVPFFAHVLSRTFMDIQRYWYVLLITQAIAFYGKYQERQLLSSQLEAQLANAQLEVLKIQLEPHFLFNTLNSIAALARHDGEAAEHMTLQLADLLRMSLDGVGVHEVPLQQELTVPAEVHRHSADPLPRSPAGRDATSIPAPWTRLSPT